MGRRAPHIRARARGGRGGGGEEKIVPSHKDDAERPQKTIKTGRRAKHVSVQGLGVVPGHEDEAG